MTPASRSTRTTGPADSARSAPTLVSCRYRSPIGVLTLVASDLGLRAVLWPDDPDGRVRFEAAVIEGEHPELERARTQLDEYFARTRRSFDLRLDARGTDFQRQVWSSLADIEFGETISYGEQARRLGRPTATRAVGAANGRNPLSVVLPCHRVVSVSGALTGFAGGLDRKASLLDFERATLDDA